MIRNLSKLFKGFAKDEQGSMVVPFALWTPVFLGLILSTIELGTVTIRHTALERALDETVREVRLGTISSHDAIKQSVCDKAAVLPDCMNTMHLEMLPLDLRDWTPPVDSADCRDVSEEVTPNRNFTNGGDMNVMFLRACFKYRPITPAGTLSSSLGKDAEGLTGLVSTAAYVQEPS